MKNSLWTGLTALLGSVCLLLLALALLCALLLGGAPEPALISDNEPPSTPELDDLKSVSFNERPGEDYSAAILQQPLFFADRSLPEIIDEQEAARLAAAAEQQAEEEEPVATVELDARLAGIIITPDKRIAMIADNKSKKTMVLREGMALEGEQAGWQLAQIKERTVSFAAGQESTELELKVNTEGLQAPAANVSATRVNTANTEQTDDQQQADNQQQSAQQVRTKVSEAASQREQTAAEIRRRIAERRAQLRAERAKQAQDGNN